MSPRPPPLRPCDFKWQPRRTMPPPERAVFRVRLVLPFLAPPEDSCFRLRCLYRPLLPSWFSETGAPLVEKWIEGPPP